MSQTPFDPITPEQATPESLMEVLTAYRTYLDERANFVREEDPDRWDKIASSLAYCEKVVIYYLSFCLSSPSLVTEQLQLLTRCRTMDTGGYPVPDLLAAARQLAKSARRTAPAPRTQAPSTEAPMTLAEHQASLDLFDSMVRQSQSRTSS